MIDAVAVIAAIGSILATITAAGAKGLWVWGWVLDRQVAETEFWRSAFLKATAVKDETISSIETKVVGG